MAVTRAGTQSALIVEVPEAEPAVARLRERLDAKAPLGIPAHFTVLFPFTVGIGHPVADLRAGLGVPARRRARHRGHLDD